MIQLNERWLFVFAICIGLVCGVIGFYIGKKINPPASIEYLDGYFEQIFELFGSHTATWDLYIQANEIEKHIYWHELDSIRMELNMKLKPKPEPFRGSVININDLFSNLNN